MAVLIMAAAALVVVAQTATPAPERDGVFLHVSHGTGDPHRALMALRMAELMSEDHDVLVYFDISGIDLVLKDAPDVQFKQFPSSKAQLQKLIERGVTLVACPGCLQAAGKTAADLAPGIKVSEKQMFFDFTKGRILSLDY
jgi:predicted peroxiredoxin